MILSDIADFEYDVAIDELPQLLPAVGLGKYERHVHIGARGKLGVVWEPIRRTR
jgi:hypothetical protein